VTFESYGHAAAVHTVFQCVKSLLPLTPPLAVGSATFFGTPLMMMVRQSSVTLPCLTHGFPSSFGGRSSALSRG
jgi:hypothetical protein